ncbi:HAD family hydrolase [Patescibacteria group bacterium]|nr:HAD family hydrolase [Patescibacteria group bacterium]
MNTLIFDFNRTLFEPETGALYPDAYSTCVELKRRGYRLLLLSQEKAEREGLITELGLETLFERVLLTPTKDVASFQALLEGLETKEIFVIGDGEEREIRIGHLLGYRGIWLDRTEGAFGYPNYLASPWQTIHELHALLDLLP